MYLPSKSMHIFLKRSAGGCCACPLAGAGIHGATGLRPAGVRFGWHDARSSVQLPDSSRQMGICHRSAGLDFLVSTYQTLLQRCEKIECEDGLLLVTSLLHVASDDALVIHEE